MSITLVNPDGLPKVEIYRQVSVATGSRTVYIAGQVAWDAEGNTVGVGDFAAQVEQSFLNVATALAGVGGSVHDLVKLTVYVADWSLDKMPLLVEGLTRASTRLGVDVVPLPPSTMIGIGAPFTPDLMVEIEATAVLD